MQKTNTFNNSGPAPGRLLLLILPIIALMTWASFSLLGEQIGQRGQDLTLETFSAPPFNLSVNALGDVEVPLPVDNGNMPNCGDFDLKGCNWESKLQSKVDGGDRVIETDLVQDGKVVGKVQVLEVNTIEYEELKVLSEMGHDKAWISHIQVAKAYRGQGLGRALWQASDAMLKVLVGSGNAIHLFVDQAGWGNSIMKNVPAADILITWTDSWAYVVR